MDPGSRIVVGDLEVRPRERTALIDQTELPLTPGEFEIVMALAEHPGWVFSAEQLSSDAMEGDSPESVSVLVSRLRQKLVAAGARDEIETVRGFGYRIRARGEPSEETAPTSARALRDAAWLLQEAVIEAEHTGTAEQQDAAAEVLDEARHAIFARLAE